MKRAAPAPATADDSATSDNDKKVVELSERRTRVRFPSALPPVSDGSVPYAKSRPELRKMNDGELMRAIVDTPAWQETIVPACEELDRTRAHKGPKGLYTSEELEYALVYQLFSGLRCYREGRDRLAGDRGAAVRAALGLDRPRMLRGNRVASLRSGVPSEPTISRHLARFEPEQRLAAYRDFFERLVAEHLSFPEFREEARVLHMDGTHVLTHFTCPVYPPLTNAERRAREQSDEARTLAQLCEIDESREVVNADSVTCPDGGYLPTDRETGKAGGDGFNLVAVVPGTAVPLDFALVPINVGERPTALAMLRERFLPNVVPLLDPTQLHVLTADSGFTNPELRALLQSLGILDNIHMVSHANTERSIANAEKRRSEEIPIEGYPNWHANGLREIACACGWAELSQRLERGGHGQAVARVEGHCRNCGPITISSGQWQLVQNPKRFRRVSSATPVARRDWTFGNPLTFDSPISAAYGKARFGQNEGFHGALERRFRLIKGKRWYRSRVEAEIDTTVIFSVMHALAMEQRRRAGATTVPLLELAA